MVFSLSKFLALQIIHLKVKKKEGSGDFKIIILNCSLFYPFIYNLVTGMCGTASKIQ